MSVKNSAMFAAFIGTVISFQFAPASIAQATIKSSAADRLDVKEWKAKTIPARPKIGLALGGGGTRGAAHVPVLRALEAEGIKPDIITGTSIGAVVGGLYAAGVPLDKIERGFQDTKIMKHFMTVPLWVRLVVAPIMVTPRLFGSKPFDGLYKGNAFREYLVHHIDNVDPQIQDLKIPFAAVCLNLLDGRPYMVRQGSLGYAMQASAAVPALRKPVEIDNKLFVDGGVICNLPVKQCRELGADFVIAVNIDEPFAEAPLDSFRKIGSVTRRMVSFELFNQDESQGELADVLIHPNLEGISLISTKKKDAIRALAEGEKAAKEAMPLIRRRLNLGMAESGRTN